MPSSTASQRGNPRVCVGIVNWNTRELLTQCLDSLMPDCEAGVVEVVVVDNSSSDGSADHVAAAYPAVRLIRNPQNAGFTRAVNQAFDAADAEYFLMRNGDARVTPGAIRHCIEYLDVQGDVAAVGCRITYPDGRPQSSCFRFPSPWGVVLTTAWLSQAFPDSAVRNWGRYGRRDWEAPRDVDCVMGSFLLLRRTAIGGPVLLDGGFWMYGEEADLCFRLQRAGWRVVYLPDAGIVHHHGASTRDAERAAWGYAARQRAILRFIRKWRGDVAGWLANLVMALGMLPRAAGWWRADAASRFRAGKHSGRHLRARVLGFHLAACVRPSRLGTSWEPAGVRLASPREASHIIART